MGGLDSTFDLLRTERSEYADTVWLAALGSDRRFVREAAFKASLQGAPLVAQLEVIRRWKTLDDASRRLLGEAIGKFHSGLRHALSSHSEDDRAAAMAIALSLKINSVVPELIHLAEECGDATGESAARVVLRLAQSLRASREDENNESLDDHTLARVAGSLEQAVKRFGNHRRFEVVEAFLLLIEPDNDTLLSILDSPSNINLVAVLKELQRTQFEILPDRLVIGFVRQDRVVPTIDRLWQSRDTERFIQKFLATIGDSPGRTCETNLRRLTEITWLPKAIHKISQFRLNEQRGLLAIACHCDLDQELIRQLLCELALNAEIPVRVDATKRLAKVRTDEVNQFMLQLADSAPPEVKAEALKQLKERNLPGAMSRLRAALQSTEDVVKEVAVAAFREYTMDWFLNGFDMMDEEARYPNGQIVLQVDDQALKRLRHDLEANGKRTRIRAVNAASVLNLLDQVEDLVAALLTDQDQFVRLEAINALASCGSAEAKQAINSALTDESRSVREAAGAALQRLAMPKNRATAQ